MESGPKAEDRPRGGLGALILAKVVCCGGLVLVASGAFGGVGVWSLDGGLVWLALAAALAAVGLFSWRRRKSRRAASKTSPRRIGAERA